MKLELGHAGVAAGWNGTIPRETPRQASMRCSTESLVISFGGHHDHRRTGLFRMWEAVRLERVNLLVTSIYLQQQSARLL